MSLPEGKLTLQGLPQLGDANSKKHAMIVRLSAETMEALDRLESGAKIDIDFGEGSSKLYIGDSSFTLSTLPEPVTHELYLRMVAANKPGAAVLKLQGNVVGKLTVERQLNAQAEAAVRDRTQQAEKQRHERKIELLDAPLAQAPRSSLKKSKAPGKPPKSVPAGHAPPPDPNRTVSGSTSLQPSQAASPRISPRPSSASAPEKSARYRLIHCVALKPRTLKQILDLVGGDDKERRKEVRDLMPEVLEKVPGQETMFRLKTESWLEVRPFENTYLRPDEVQKLVEQGQEALKRLFVDESNALWNHFRREGGPAPSTSRGVRASPVPPPAETKKPAVKKRPTEATKKKVADTIPMKDESVRPPKVEVKVKDREESPTTSAAAAKSAQRRLPGSGHRVNSQSTTPPTLSDTAPTTAALSKRQGVDRDIKRDAPSPAPGSSRPSTSMPPPPGKVIKREDPESKKRESSQASRVDDTREKKRSKPEPGEIEQSPRKRPREIAESDYSDRDSVASFGTKRHKPNERDSDRERMPARAKAKAKAEHRDVSAIKKQSRDASPLPARVKEEREPTPLMRSPVPVPRSPALPPRPQLPPERGASVTSNGVRDAQREEPPLRHGSAKGRRREPSFTSSSEEDAPAAKERKRGRSPGPGAGKLREREREPPRKAGPLPSDVRALRRLYDERIPEFVALRSKKKRLRDEMKRVARRMRDEGVDDLSTDCELPDDAECESLRNAEAAAREECVRIRDALYRLTGQEIPEDGGLWSEDTD